MAKRVEFLKDAQIQQFTDLLDSIILRLGESPEFVLKDILIMVIGAHSFSNTQRQLILDDICTTYGQRIRKIFE
jgi:hypothetical protein